MNAAVGLDDVEWGDVISDADGVLVIRGEVGDLPVVVKRFADTPYRREIGTYRLLDSLGVPTLPLFGSGDDWLILEDLVSAGYRAGTEADLANPGVARLLARWYATLHTAGDTLAAPAIDYGEIDLIDEPALARVSHRWPELAGFSAWAAGRLPGWRETLAALPLTLTYNDFWFSNLAVGWDGSSALMFDYNLMGAGLAVSDLRNVSNGLSPEAAEAFLDEYASRKPGADANTDATAKELDEATSHVVALILAAEASETPDWVRPSLAWARDQVPAS